MDIYKVLSQLHAELESVNAAIVSLERLQQGTKGRGRPAEWLTEVGKSARGALPRQRAEAQREQPLAPADRSATPTSRMARRRL